MSKRNEIGLVMPCNYDVVKEEEMQYIEGGNTFSFKCSRTYLNKVNCYNYANAIIRYHGITGMTQLEVAAEIYAHAKIYYAVSSLPTNNIVTALFKKTIGAELLARTAIIDIESGGDKRTGFKLAYNWIWDNIG